ncbi:ATP synthase F1 subunit delta [Hippea alviniae]|uniref:ATP synthase F1 subunit delta n=1 Tax=Hippea alviniae TaxID=1279027 RepID=UPI0003B5CD43|nr:ATP synthase F1 subunit delta [Hippea alviniae]
MIDKKVSVRYARALLELCEEKNTDENEVLSTLNELSKILKENPKLFEYLAAYVVPFESKAKVIEGIVEGNLLVEFLKYVAKKGRFKLIFDIIELFEELVYDKQNRVKAFVKSAVELDDEIKEQLKEQLSKKLNKQIEFEFEVDKDLIGGIIVQVKDVVYDGSLKTYLTNLEQRLLKLSV